MPGCSGCPRWSTKAYATAGVRGADRADVGVYCLAGADTPSDVRELTGRLAAGGFARNDLLRNDTFAALRAGTDRGWGVVVICGQGVNAAGVAPDGRTARLDALGAISGDWGGATGVGWEGLAAAVRARDGRGPRTVLERTVPGHFGLATPRALTMAMYHGRVSERRIGELSPVVFAAAMDGDEAARAIVDRLADELVAMAGAMIRRLRLTRSDPEVVLGGGVFRTPDEAFRRPDRGRGAGDRPASAAGAVEGAARRRGRVARPGRGRWRDRRSGGRSEGARGARRVGRKGDRRRARTAADPRSVSGVGQRPLTARPACVSERWTSLEHALDAG